MKRRTRFWAALVAIVAVAGLGLSGAAFAGVATSAETFAMLYLGEVLVAGLIAGLLLLLDTTSWSLMTSRR